MSRYFVYILKCENDGYYVGFTSNLSQRVTRHQKGQGSKYTKDFTVEELVYFESFNDKENALNRERQLKGWSRVKKEALIAGDKDRLRNLSRSRPIQGFDEKET